MSELENLHQSILLQLKETSSHSFNAFSQAFEVMKKDQGDALNKFKNVIVDNQYVLNATWFYLDLFIELDMSEDFLYMGQLLNLDIKSTHNIIVLYRNKKDKEKMNEYEKRKILYQGHLYFIHHLSRILKTNNQIKLIIEAFLRDFALFSISKAIGNLYLYDYLSRHDLLGQLYGLDYLNEYKDIDQYFDDITALNNSELNNIIKQFKDDLSSAQA